MDFTPPDDRTPGVSEDDIEEAEVARLVTRYLYSDEAVSDDELQKTLEKFIQGLVVSVSRGEGEVTVIVERASDEGDEPIRDSYTVQAVSDFENDPRLKWSYLGAAN